MNPLFPHMFDFRVIHALILNLFLLQRQIRFILFLMAPLGPGTIAHNNEP